MTGAPPKSAMNSNVFYQQSTYNPNQAPFTTIQPGINTMGNSPYKPLQSPAMEYDPFSSLVVSKPVMQPSMMTMGQPIILQPQMMPMMYQQQPMMPTMYQQQQMQPRYQNQASNVDPLFNIPPLHHNQSLSQDRTK
uniref:Uncharacterized protein n=1 Tax=Lygus hesperus TaxID=30085 RepID=A0A0A9ZFY5_LYGHE